MKIKFFYFYAEAILLGILTGGLGTLFQWCIVHFQNNIIEFSLKHILNSINLTMGLCSMILVALSYFLVRYDMKEAAGSGIQQIEGILKKDGPMNWRRLLPIKFFGGLLSISAFMVLGREGPTVQMGAHLGKMLSNRFKWKRQHTHLLIAAGASAGLATAFNAPIASLLFVIEELRYHLDINQMDMPFITICVFVSILVLQYTLGTHPSIEISIYHMPPFRDFGYFLLFGVLLGFFGIIFNQMLIVLLKKHCQLPSRLKWAYVILIGFIAGYWVFKYPLMVGSGELLVKKLASSHFHLNILIIMCSFRLLMTLLCFTTGLPGGVFSPLLGLGTLLGLTFHQLLQSVFHIQSIDAGVFALAGMAGLFSASIQAPLTGIVLIVEMTQNYNLILPLMLTCISAHFIARFLHAVPLYTRLRRL